MSAIFGIIDWDRERAAKAPLSLSGDDERQAAPTVIAGFGQVRLAGRFARAVPLESPDHSLFLVTPGRSNTPLRGGVSGLLHDPLEALGGDCGEFAYALVDEGRKQMTLAVDLFGSVPLYFARSARAVLFSTDLRLLAHHGQVASTLSNQALYSYLYFSVIPAPATVYEEIYRLPPGHLVQFDENGQSMRSWYRPRSEESLPGEEFASRLQDGLGTSVRDAWTRAESPTACFLSGGLDSSTVCGLASRVSEQPVSAFSIGFPESDYDEIPYARMASDAFGLDHHVHYVDTEEVTSNIDRFVKAFGEPFSNASTITAYVCAEKARAGGFPHMLAGDGGDEMFAGNERYGKQSVLHRFDELPALLRSAVLALRLHRWPLPGTFPGRVRSYFRQVSMPFAKRSLYNNFIELEGYQNVFSDRFLADVDTKQPVTFLQSLFDDAPFDDFVKKMLYVDWRITLADNDLRKIRVACGLAGVDVNFPMLDPRVVAVMESMPGELMMPGGRLRGFYKDAFRHLLPERIIDKPKHGFGVPVGRWMRTDPDFARLVDGRLSALAQRGMFRPEFIGRVRRSHTAEDAVHYGVVLWTLVILEMWLEGADQASVR